MSHVIGKGSIVRRDRYLDGRLKPRHRCRVWDLSITMDDGTHPSERFEGTEREARNRLAEWTSELEERSEEAIVPTFSEYADEWARTRRDSGMVAKRTADCERWRLNAAKMHLGGLHMDAIAPRDVERCYAALMRGDSPSGKKWSPKSVEDLHKTMSTLFGTAVRDGMLSTKPTTDTRRPKVPDQPREVPSGDALKEFEQSLSCFDPHELACILAVSCGLRRSEAVALDWSDWDGKRLHVLRAAEEDGTPKPTKNTHPREVPVPREVRNILDALADDGPLLGIELKPKSLTRWWSRNRWRWNMDGVRFHDFRHAYATRLAEAGVHPRVMMQLGGWDSIDVCMNIYTHVNSEALDAAVEAAFS